MGLFDYCSRRSVMMIGIMLLVMCICATIKVLARQRSSVPTSTVDTFAPVWKHTRPPPKRDFSDISDIVMKRINEQRSESAIAAAAAAAETAAVASAHPISTEPLSRQRLISDVPS